MLEEPEITFVGDASSPAFPLLGAKAGAIAGSGPPNNPKRSRAKVLQPAVQLVSRRVLCLPSNGFALVFLADGAAKRSAPALSATGSSSSKSRSYRSKKSGCQASALLNPRLTASSFLTFSAFCPATSVARAASLLATSVRCAEIWSAPSLPPAMNAWTGLSVQK